MESWIHYSGLQCHMILQKSFWYADLVLNKHLLSLFMLKRSYAAYTFLNI